MGRSAKTVVALVGSNPVPVLLAVRALQASHAVLLPTEQTRARAEALKNALEGGGCQATMKQLTSAAGPGIDADVRQAFAAAVDPGAHLHYTGGTKAMAVRAALALSNEVGSDRRSYLDDRDRRLLFDDGYSQCLPGDDLDVPEVMGLHGWKAKDDASRSPVNLDQLVATLVDDLRSGGERTRLLHETFKARKNFKANMLQGLDVARLHLPDELAKQLCGQMRNKEASVLACLLSGDWLEDWVAGLVKQVSGVPPSVGIQVGSSDFELDVVSGAGGRLRILSCTTDQSQSLVKGKAFEVAFRGRQLGDQTRLAVVSALDGDATQQVAQSVRSGWDTPTELRVFGLDDLVCWQRSDLSTLETWWGDTK